VIRTEDVKVSSSSEQLELELQAQPTRREIAYLTVEEISKTVTLSTIKCSSGRNLKCNVKKTRSVRNTTLQMDVSWALTSRRSETQPNKNVKGNAQRISDAWVLSSSERVVLTGPVMLTMKEIAYLTVALILNGPSVMLPTIRCTSGPKEDSLNVQMTILMIPKQEEEKQ